MDRRQSKLVARLSAALVVVAGGASYLALLGQPDVDPNTAAPVHGAMVFVLVGALILAKAGVPATGWVVSLIGMDIILLELSGHFDGGPLDGLLWFSSFLLLGLLFLLFPSGRTPGPRWRWVLRIGIGAEVGAIAGGLAFPGWAYPGCDVGSSILCRAVEIALYTGLEGFVILSVAGLVVRYRRSAGVERLQLKWFLTAVLFVIVAMLTGDLAQARAGGLWLVVQNAALATIPASIALAVFRYRLYDIDRIVSRTVTYLVVAGVMGGVFFTIVTAVSSLLPTQGSLAVAGSTMAVAAIFNPIRRRVQRVVDRRFDRSRYDAERVMAGFAGGLGGRLDAGGVASGWVAVVSETMHPTVAGVWVRDSARGHAVPPAR